MNIKLLEGNDGEVHNVTEWANILGISRSHLRHRMKNGEDFLDIIKSPRKYKKHKHGGLICTAESYLECFDCSFPDCIRNTPVNGEGFMKEGGMW